MSDAKLRHAIAFEAARLMYERVESEYFTAKRKAAKRLCRGTVKPSDLPSNAEIRDQVQLFARPSETSEPRNSIEDGELRQRAVFDETSNAGLFHGEPSRRIGRHAQEARRP